MPSNPFVGVNFELGRNLVVIEWSDGIEEKSRIVSLGENNIFARVSEVSDNAIRFILNELERRNKQLKERKTNE